MECAGQTDAEHIGHNCQRDNTHTCVDCVMHAVVLAARKRYGKGHVFGAVTRAEIVSEAIGDTAHMTQAEELALRDNIADMLHFMGRTNLLNVRYTTTFWYSPRGGYDDLRTHPCA